MNIYLDIFSVLALIGFVGISLRKIENGILFGILIKPLIDTSWDVKFAGLSIIEMFSILFLLISFQFALNRNLFRLIPKNLLLFWTLAHLGVLMSIFYDPLEGIKSLMKFLYMPLGFMIIPYFLISKSLLKKKLLKYLIYGSLFSSLISVLQFVGIIPYEFEHTSKGLQRANGFYHDMVTSRIYVLQGLLTLAYILHSKEYKLKNIYLYLSLGIFMLASYAMFSKAMIGILAFGAVLLFLTKKLKLQYILIALPILIYFVFFNSTIVDTSEQLFIKEIEYNEGNVDENQLFSGRGSLWADFLTRFDNSQPLEQLFGLGINSGRTHNEFLRSLILSGFIGFISYSLFMVVVLKNSIIAYFKKSRFNFILLFSVIILAIDAFSVVWGLYPFYILVIIGLYHTCILKSKEKKYATTYAKTRLW